MPTNNENPKTYDLEDLLGTVRTAVTALTEIESKLLSMRELSLMAAKNNKTDAYRAELDKIFQQKKSEIGELATGKALTNLLDYIV